MGECTRCGLMLAADTYGYPRGFGYHGPLCNECVKELRRSRD